MKKRIYYREFSQKAAVLIAVLGMLVMIHFPAYAMENQAFELMGAGNSTNIALIWDELPEAENYNVEVKTGDTWTTIQSFPKSKTAKTYSSLINGNTYTYRIVAINADGTAVAISNEYSYTIGGIKNLQNPDKAVQEQIDAVQQQYITDIYNDINEMRAEKGEGALTIDSDCLTRMAKYRVEDMISNEYFSHYKDGKMQIHVLRKVFNFPGNKSIGENIVISTRNTDVGHYFAECWKNSPGHYENIIDPIWLKTGIAVEYNPNDGFWYGVQLFGNN